MNKYKIEFVWFFQGQSFEESVSIPARSQELAVEKVKAVWGNDVEVAHCSVRFEMKIGDTVVITNDQSCFYKNIGCITEVIMDNCLPYIIQFDDEDTPCPFDEDELELVQ